MKDNIYFELLKKYCDGLISLQFMEDDKSLYGGFWCRSCKMIHGRSPDGVYPLAVMYKHTGEEKYLRAAEACFDYGENMLCDDGALYNDSQTTWRYTTVFHTISVIDTIRSLKGLLSCEFSDKLYCRAEKMANWLYHNLNEHSGPNINYATTNALALQLSGMLFDNAEYLDRAKHLAEYAMKHFTDEGLFYGESKDHDAISSLGCRSVDIGYDMEESIPSLVKYAHLAKNEEMLAQLTVNLAKMSNFVLPDGALDNSFGNRNNKWTYWGSRTSDGICPAYLILADRVPYFAECAYRNVVLQSKCTYDGILHAGLHYRKNGQYACTHHTFEHAIALAFAVDEIDERYLKFSGCAIPSESEQTTYYKSINTFKITRGDYLATITGYDFDMPFSGHAGGGTMTMLWNKKCGAMIAASVTDYELAEPTNMQQSLDVTHHRPLVPRLIKTVDGVRYSSSFYASPKMKMTQSESQVEVSVITGLATRKTEPLANEAPKINYTVSKMGVRIEISDAEDMIFVLPLISGNMQIFEGSLENTDRIFFLTGGFEAEEYTVLPNSKGRIRLEIKA